MSQDDVVYLDGFRLTYGELGTDRKGLNVHLFGRVVPFMIDEEMRSLYITAKNHKGPLTPAEQNRVLGRMPPEEEELLCQKRLRCSSEQLYEKAKTTPHELSMLECDMIIHGFDYDWKTMYDRVSLFERMTNLSREDRQLVLVARGELEGVAYMKAVAKRKEYTQKRSEDADRLKEELKEARDAPRARWLQEVLDKGAPQWGFVVFRTADNDICDNEAWHKFRTYYNRECENVYRSWTWKPSHPTDLWKTHESVFISVPTLDGASTDDLRSWFKAKRDEFPEGIRRDCFLVADEDTLTNEWILGVNERDRHRRTPLHQRASVSVTAVNPDYDPSEPPATIDYGYESSKESVTQEDLEGYVGEIRVPIHKVFDWLYYTLLMNNETWGERYTQTTQTKPVTRMPYWPYPSY